MTDRHATSRTPPLFRTTLPSAFALLASVCSAAVSAQPRLMRAGDVDTILLRAAARRGNIECRRYDHVGGGWPGTFLDAANAADYVRTLAPSHPLDTHGWSR